MKPEPIVLQLQDKELTVTSSDKVYFPRRGETKLDLIDYYQAVEPAFLRAAGGRPTLMQRFPNGVSGKSFFQKRVPKGAPSWLQTTVVSTPNGTESNALVLADLAHVVWAVNLGCLGFHLWPTKAADLSVADELRIDLDPTPGTTFDDVRFAAEKTKELLAELGIKSFPKTTGSKGIHIYVRLKPLWDSYQVRFAAVALARELERRYPAQLTAKWWKEERGERIFIDFNQNAPHKTVFGAWSVRSRVGAQVSTPFYWEELDSIEPDSMTMDVVPRRLANEGDPWLTVDDDPQLLDPLLAMHEKDMQAGLMDAPWPPVYPKQPNEPPRVAPSRAKKSDAE